MAYKRESITDPPYYLTAYGLAVKHGYTGTEEEWLASLQGHDAYTEAVKSGYEGTAEEFYAALADIEDAVTDAEAAQSAAETANTAAQEAKTDAETASGQAQDAQSLAEAAQSAAESAMSTAQSAATAAGTAQTAAETAQTAAEAARDQAVATAAQDRDDLGFVTGNEVYELQQNKAITTNSDYISSLTPVNYTYTNCAVIECSEGDQFTLSGEGHGAGSVVLWAFVGEEEASGYPVKRKASAGAAEEHLVLTAAADEKHLIFCPKNEPTTYEGKIIKGKTVPQKLSDMNAEISAASANARNEALVAQNFVLVDSTVKPANAQLYIDRLSKIHYIKLTGFAGYSQVRLRYIARNSSTAHYRIIFCGFNGSEWEDALDSGSSFTVTENQNGDTYVTFTKNGRTAEMYIDYANLMDSNKYWNIESLSSAPRYIVSPAVIDQSNEEIPKADVYAINSDGTLSVLYQYSATQIAMVKFEPFGVNGLYHPRYFYKKSGTELRPEFTGFTLGYTLSTDWVGPYAYITDKGDSERSDMTVGGNHGTTGGTAFPTAERQSVDIYMDGEPMADDTVCGGSSVKAVVVTNVAASNTINMETGAFDPALEETTVWTITPDNFEVSVHLNALKNIEIGGYTGLQMTSNWLTSPTVYFNDGEDETLIGGTAKDSVAYPTFTGNRTVLCGSDGVTIGVLYTNREVGIGDLSHIDDGEPPAYLSTNNKVYQHLVNGIKLELDQGEGADYSGGYTMMESYPCTGAKAAYFISYNGERRYCVDFLGSGETYVKLPKALVGHTITVISKDECVSIGSIISGQGLHVSSTGIGSVEFSVD